MDKGKNFSSNNTKGNRKKSDFYETPYSMTESILNELKIDLNTTILEPSAGSGAIVSVLNNKGYKNVKFGDISTGQDFLTHKYGRTNWIITNPPFSLAFEFIERAKEISSNILLLLPLNYLHGKQRYDEIYTDLDFSLKEIHVFIRYPMLGEKLREDGKYKTGMLVYAWFWFQKGNSNPPLVKWIDNNKYILKKGE